MVGASRSWGKRFQARMALRVASAVDNASRGRSWKSGRYDWFVAGLKFLVDPSEQVKKLDPDTRVHTRTKKL